MRSEDADILRRILRGSYEPYVQDPFGTGVRLALRSIIAIGIAGLATTLAYARSANPLVLLAMGGASVLAAALCFGYAYAGHKVGEKRARDIFLVIAAVVLLLLVYVAIQVADKL